MKQLMLWMAIVGLATTGCAQNRVLGTHARRGGGANNFATARSQATSGQNTRFAGNQTQERFADESYDESEIDLAMYSGRCRGGCNCSAGSECGGGCDVGCDDGCCGGGGGCDIGGCDGGGCADGCCGDGGCSVGGGRVAGGRLGGRMSNMGGRLGGGGGCSACGGGGCGLCQRMGGRLGGGCSACGGNGCGLCRRVAGRVASGFCPHGGGYPANYNFNPSPPSGQVAYPYYTVKGPRDFLQNNPSSIGPY